MKLKLVDATFVGLGRTNNIPAGYSLVMQFDDNATTTSRLQLKDLSDNSCLVDWGDGSLQEISTSSQTTSPIVPTRVKIYSRNGLKDFFSTDNNFDFNISILPYGLTYLYCDGNNTISGDVADFPSTATDLYVLGDNTVSGDIVDFPPNVTDLSFSGNNTISGDIADLPSTVTYARFRGKNQINAYTSPHTFNSSIDYFYCLQDTGYGLDSTEVDNLLVDLNNSGMSTGTINIGPPNAVPTATGDAAITALYAAGVSSITVSV